MKYRINNLKCIESKEDRKVLKQLIAKQIDRLVRIGDHYPKNFMVNIYLSKSDKLHYDVSVVLYLKEHVIYHKETGKHIEEAVYRLFDKVKLTLSKKIARERKEYLHKRKKQRFANFNERVDDLQELKKAEKQDVFKDLIRILLEEVSGYILRRLRAAEKTTAISKGKFTIHDLLDEIYVRVYDRLDEMPDDKSKINAWLYRLSDSLLEEKFKEAEFEKENFEQLANIVESEYESFDEGYMLNADGNPVPYEEFDERIPADDRYHAESLLFNENENSFLDEITLNINKDEIHLIIEKELAKLPVMKRSIMDLYLMNQMTEEEIAEVKGMPLKDVKDLISEANEMVKQKIRYLL